MSGPSACLASSAAIPASASTYCNGDVVEYTILSFECAVVGGFLEARDGESLQLRYFPVQDVESMAAPEVYRCALQTSAVPALFHWDERWLENLEP